VPLIRPMTVRVSTIRLWCNLMKRLL
jgi:hypothetical protein